MLGNSDEQIEVLDELQDVQPWFAGDELNVAVERYGGQLQVARHSKEKIDGDGLSPLQQHQMLSADPPIPCRPDLRDAPLHPRHPGEHTDGSKALLFFW